MILLSVSCREEIQGWEQLTADERTAINNRAMARCNSNNAGPKAGFKETSAAIFTNVYYARNYGYIGKYTKEGSSSETASVELRVWKQDSTNNVLYFYVTEVNGSINTNYFLKVNQVQNEEIIDDLVTDYCENKVYSYLYSDDDGPMSVTYTYDKATTSGTDTYADTYTFQFGQLAFMAAHSLSRRIDSKNSSGTITATTKYTSTYTQKTYTDTGLSTDYSDYTQSFCELAEETTGIYRLSQTVIGFKLGTCASSLPADWDLTI